MQDNWQSRTELLIGEKGIEKLSLAHVLVCGLGGVGSAAVEFLCRAGIGEITIVDHDKVNSSNRNRQLLALVSTEDSFKADVIASRLMDINPNLKLNIKKLYLIDEVIPEIINIKYDYVVDAIDTLAPKVYLIFHCVSKGLRLISSLGTGGKLDPSQIQISDISKSYNCNLAYYLRKRLHKLGIRKGFKVVFSPEEIQGETITLERGIMNKKTTIGTISYMPAIFGAYCASVVIRDILEEKL